MSCPSRGELLDLLLSDQDIPHLEECDDCADYVEKYFIIDDEFGGRPEEFRLAVRELIDEALEDLPSKDWAAELARDRELHHAFVVEELQRRTIAARENPSIGLDLTATAVALCEAMENEGSPPPAQLFFDVLKERAMMLRAANELDAAIETLAQASAKASELENREQLDAIVALCTAVTYSEADKGQFEEAIALAESAAVVLERWGDRRRAAMARQARAHALACMSRFAEALPIILPVATEYDAMDSVFDAANAHHLAAHCYAELGRYDEALGHALVAQCGYEKIGNTALAARAWHVVARATAGLGRFEEARSQFEEAAEVVWAAGLYEVWVLDRLDYVSAALHHDSFADVRGDVESIARVCFMLGRENSTMRRQYAAEALAYLRQLAKRDALTAVAADYVRDYMSVNASRPPVRFRPPQSGDFVM
jgi:tetratricopeptide (TPR) repeat protein